MARKTHTVLAPAPATPIARPSYGVAGLVSLVVFLLYLATLAPTTAMWDTSEYITAAYTLGLPHPPGNPLFVLLGRVFSLLPIAPTVAQRVNILAAVMSAIAAGAWFLIAERVFASRFTARWQRLLAGALAALVSATAFTVWNQSVVNEKVYTVSLCFFALVSWLTVLWCDDPASAEADRLLVLIAFLIGLGYSNHPAGFLVAPAVGAAVLARRARTLLRWRVVLSCALALGLGLTPFLFEPIRAAHHPALNEGEPTGCIDRLGWRCTFSETTYTRLAANINREQFGKPPLDVRQAPFSAQMGMWWLYFKWQWLRDPGGNQPLLQTMLAAVFLMLGIYGGVLHWRFDRRSFWFFGPLIATVTIVLVFYMNFKYGASQAPQLGDNVPREVRDRDYFFLWSYSAWGVWAAFGLVGVWIWLVERRGGGKEVKETGQRGVGWTSWAAAAPVLLLAVVPLVANWGAASRRGDTFTRDFAIDLLNSVEPYGVLITAGDNDTFPLWYAQEVEGVRRDVTVAVRELLGTDWYVRGIIRRPIYEYDARNGPAIYRNRLWKKPTAPAIRMTLAEADAVPQFMQIDGPQLFRKDSLVATLDPHNMPNDGAGHAFITRPDLIVLRMISDSAPDRPVYLSRTTANYGATLGLDPYLLMQGLARKIELAPIHARGDTALVRGAGFVDVARTQALWKGFRAPDSLLRRRRWVDMASISMPFTYINTGQVLAAALSQRGQVDTARRVFDRADQIARAVGFSLQ